MQNLIKMRLRVKTDSENLADRYYSHSLPKDARRSQIRTTTSILIAPP